MCSTATVWAGLKQVALGYSIHDSLNQEKKRINLTCNELFKRAGASIEIISNIKKEECGLLYNDQVRKSINRLRNADSARLAHLAEELKNKRINWFNKQKIQNVSFSLSQYAFLDPSRVIVEDVNHSKEEDHFTA